MTLFLLAFVFWCGILGIEAIRLRRWRDAVPLRICVTGTRGKTTLVRLLASVLREDGRRVLAKSTGSQAAVILPDGREERLKRRGKPTILEQIRLLRRGAELGVEVLVVEVMSIHEENHLVESRRILKPHLTLVTNFRVDHTEAVGCTREEVAGLHLLDVHPGGRVMIHRDHLLPNFRAGVEALGAELEVVGSVDPLPSPAKAFPEILALVWAAGRALGVADDAIGRGIESARGDLGELWVRRYGTGGPRKGGFVANAFAANDPHSTQLALERVRARLVAGGKGGAQGDSSVAPPTLGILNLRRDRGDRTLQWVEALEGGVLDELQQLFLVGFHGPAVLRRLKAGPWKGRVRLLAERDPGRAMSTVFGCTTTESPLVFGFGNIGGMGAVLAEHWLALGTEVEGDSHGA